MASDYGIDHAEQRARDSGRRKVREKKAPSESVESDDARLCTVGYSEVRYN